MIILENKIKNMWGLMCLPLFICYAHTIVHIVTHSPLPSSMHFNFRSLPRMSVYLPTSTQIIVNGFI